MTFIDGYMYTKLVLCGEFFLELVSMTEYHQIRMSGEDVFKPAFRT